MSPPGSAASADAPSATADTPKESVPKGGSEVWAGIVGDQQGDQQAIHAVQALLGQKEAMEAGLGHDDKYLLEMDRILLAQTAAPDSQAHLREEMDAISPEFARIQKQVSGKLLSISSDSLRADASTQADNWYNPYAKIFHAADEFGLELSAGFDSAGTKISLRTSSNGESQMLLVGLGRHAEGSIDKLESRLRPFAGGESVGNRKSFRCGNFPRR